MSFIAKYATLCPSCSRDIDLGDEVLYDDGAVIHLSCRTEVPQVRAADVCPDCFCVYPCFCERRQ